MARKPNSHARAIQALSRSMLRTVSYLARSNFCAARGLDARGREACGSERAVGANVPSPLAGEIGRLRRPVERQLRRLTCPHPARLRVPRRLPQAGEDEACRHAPANFASGSISPGSMPANSPTRRISAVELHRLEERDQPLVVGLVHGEVADRHVELRPDRRA